MLVAVPLAYQQQAAVVHMNRQMPISPQSDAHNIQLRMGRRSRLMKAGVLVADSNFLQLSHVRNVLSGTRLSENVG